ANVDGERVHQVGKGVEFLSNGTTMYPEMDIMEYQDGAITDSIMYGHDFSKGYMTFKPTVMGKGCSLVAAGFNHITPGVILPPFTSCSPCLNLMIPNIITEPHTCFHGNVGRSVYRGPNGEYLREGDGVIVHTHFSDEHAGTDFVTYHSQSEGLKTHYDVYSYW
ncbi:hypothetical protein CYMTET_33944, partial [Cymbomonas tetramitiformis]